MTSSIPTCRGKVIHQDIHVTIIERSELNGLTRRLHSAIGLTSLLKPGIGRDIKNAGQDTASFIPRLPTVFHTRKENCCFSLQLGFSVIL